MNRSALINLIFTKKSFLCIGLDTDLTKIPQHLLDHDDPVFEFNKAIIDATHDLAIAYKPNFAFYECNGTKGWLSLTKTIQYINQAYPGQLFSIADAKRGDIYTASYGRRAGILERTAGPAVLKPEAAIRTLAAPLYVMGDALKQLAALGGIVISPTSGFLAEAVGWPIFFLISAAISIPGLLLLKKLRPLIESLKVN